MKEIIPSCNNCRHFINFKCDLITIINCKYKRIGDNKYSFLFWEPIETKLTSKDLLKEVIDLQEERGKGYENGKERSMQKIVDMFNIPTGHNLTEVEGWFFMQCLKNVRYFTNDGVVHRDSLLDDISYSSLKAEAALNK